MDMGDIILSAFKASGRSMKSVAKEAGLSYSVVHGLLAGGVDVKLSTGTKVCRVLGLRLVADPTAKKGAKR